MASRKTRYIIAFVAAAVLAVMTSCVKEEQMPNTTQGNFEALWRIMDERYCFFEEKEKQLGVNWDEVFTI